MLFTSLLIQVIINGYAQPYPDGIFRGFAEDPYIFIDATFYEDIPSSWVHIEVKCDRNKPEAASAILDITEDPNHPGEFVVDIDDEEYTGMIGKLNEICQDREFIIDDFSRFKEVTEGIQFQVDEESRRVLRRGYRNERALSFMYHFNHLRTNTRCSL
ncbi:hypothetical protein FOZ63_030815 [Perkinsus olseni]|uniref:Uncharacterized protein n=1 Tax=Perkinsus olseni TaxID=32597 RepID=A0A7J6T1K7_PEROL|nr:hypothetical protein FOZ62_023147 [Perkinsus olseni]KAF4753312.1 hypothetical protein FOZ63_030815 [Perkinsus olseni]